MFHDHLLLHICPDYIMENLSRLKISGQELEKIQVIDVIINNFRKQIDKLFEQNGKQS